MSKLPDITKNFVGGKWLRPDDVSWTDVVQPSNEAVVGRLPLSDEEIVNEAVQAARQAFAKFATTTREERLLLFDRMIENYQLRFEEMAFAISTEMGAPISVSRDKQAAVGLWLLKAYREALASYEFVEMIGKASVLKEPIGVAGLIAPWNWPMNQIVCKVGAALAAGCTMVLKASSYAPFSATLFTEIAEASGLPDGVLNLVHGNSVVGKALARHDEIDVISFTGSTGVGVQVAIDAAPTVKRVTQELGGKAPFLVLPGSDLPAAVNTCIAGIMLNSGQSCNSPTRLLVHEEDYARAIAIAQTAVSEVVVGDPFDPTTTMGPLANKNQFKWVKHYLSKGVDEGAKLVAGGRVNPPGFEKGYYVEPTLFADVTSEMTIFREEIFGPVLCISSFKDTEQAIQLANDTEFGLTAYVFAPEKSEGLEVASRLQAGMVHVNGAPADVGAPFGGYKMSGNGRERGKWGIEEYLETKAIFS